jgi:hypothetical protein
MSDKTAKPKPQEVIFDDFDTSKEIVAKLIPKYHAELATAEFRHICRSKSSKKGGKPVPGNVYKMSGKFKHLTGVDFVMEIALDCWNELEPNQRTALIDHLLSRCVGTEDEQNGEMKWSIRPPEVQEFPEVAGRHGCWNDSLSEMRLSLEKK